MNPWRLYDDLIEGIPEDVTAIRCNNYGHHYVVTANENSMGFGMIIHVTSMPRSFQKKIEGTPLKELAVLSKSWNFEEAAMGVAAIGAYYNHPERVKSCGIQHPGVRSGNLNAFELYKEEVKGKKVAVIGHFPKLESCFEPICDLTILERNPQPGDYPDSACEYILGEQDYVFITGSTMVNKTMPRLLEVSSNSKVVFVGPSTVMSPKLFKYGVYGLSGRVVHDALQYEDMMREGKDLSDLKEMADRICPPK